MAKASLKTFDCDVRGHFNHQSECQQSSVGDLVWLVPEPDNDFDEHAIRILNSNGKDLGYVPSEDNEEILKLLGREQTEYCSKITKIEKDDSDQTLPWVTIYISNDKSRLPFQQENKFSLHTHMDGGRKTYSVRGIKSSKENGEDSNNLLIGILFIVGLIVVAKLISLIL
jgi:hypothetical protein